LIAGLVLSHLRRRRAEPGIPARTSHAGIQHFKSDDAGRLTTINYFRSWKDSSTYDLDGNVEKQLAGSGTGINDALRHDAQGRVIYTGLARHDG
jgi:hypothetical protein